MRTCCTGVGALARLPRARQFPRPGMVVGPGVRGARRPATDAGRLGRPPGIAKRLYARRWRQGFSELPRRADIAALGRRFPGPCAALGPGLAISAPSQHFSDLAAELVFPGDLLHWAEAVEIPCEARSEADRPFAV